MLPWVMMMEELRPGIAKILIVELSKSNHRKVLKIDPHLWLDRRAAVTSLELYPPKAGWTAHSGGDRTWPRKRSGNLPLRGRDDCSWNFDQNGR